MSINEIRRELIEAFDALSDDAQAAVLQRCATVPPTNEQLQAALDEVKANAADSNTDET